MDHHLALLKSYANDTLKGMEEMHRRYKRKLKQCKILWPTVVPYILSQHPPSLFKLSGDNVEINTIGSFPDTSVKVPPSGRGEAGKSISTELNTTKEGALMAVY